MHLVIFFECGKCQGIFTSANVYYLGCSEIHHERNIFMTFRTRSLIKLHTGQSNLVPGAKSRQRSILFASGSKSTLSSTHGSSMFNAFRNRSSYILLISSQDNLVGGMVYYNKLNYPYKTAKSQSIFIRMKLIFRLLTITPQVVPLSDSPVIEL